MARNGNRRGRRRGKQMELGVLLIQFIYCLCFDRCVVPVNDYIVRLRRRLLHEGAVEASVPIEEALAVLARENDVARSAASTREIVGAGKDVGLSFAEDWEDDGVDAGPLPALFLEDASRQLNRQLSAPGALSRLRCADRRGEPLRGTAFRGVGSSCAPRATRSSSWTPSSDRRRRCSPTSPARAPA